MHLAIIGNTLTTYAGHWGLTLSQFFLIGIFELLLITTGFIIAIFVYTYKKYKK